MTRLKLFFGVLPLLMPAPAQAGEGWCYAEFQDSPQSPFRLIASFTLELNARKDAGLISEKDFNWAYGEIGRANTLFGQNEPKAGCLVIEELEREYRLLPRPSPLDNSG